jgi:ATP-dependent RNA helicase SUPV3L1/SUV3
MKRLRENAMLEAEISVNGDVFVEGHHVGQLAGFRFTPVSGTEGPDAKAVQGAAQKALALEFEARAARLYASGNSDLAVGSDGSVRWLGEPIARLAPTEHVMRPRVILLSDEQLTGNAREHVLARLERFVNHHIATVLKPLDDLSRAEDLQGLAKGLAFQLVESLGVLFRRDVADDVKSLDQDARASMRRYGIRFGAYHVFMPMLLKPAPAELITLLWALKNDGLDKPGYGDLIPALAAGRTSVVADPTFERMFYKLAGFRFLGKRAVRIDILERLADLIRPLLQWKPGSTPRPEGAYDGRRFTTTTAMLSILGATPDDMEEILKGLGYRADAVKAEEAQAFLAGHDASSVNVAAAPASAGDAPEVSETDDADASEAPAETATEAAPAEAVADAAPAETVAAEPAASEEAPAEQAAAGDVTDEAKAAEAGEPKPVLLWRPGGGRENNQRGGRPQHGDRRGHGGQRNNAGGEAGQPAQGRRDERRDGGERRDARPAGERSGGERKDGGKPNRDNNRRPDNNNTNNRGGDRPNRGERHEGGPRPERNDRGKGPQPARFEAKPPRKEKPIDPDSPFAKLAALKEQMKK